jgi:hypothetical protein
VELNQQIPAKLLEKALSELPDTFTYPHQEFLLPIRLFLPMLPSKDLIGVVVLKFRKNKLMSDWILIEIN